MGSLKTLLLHVGPLIAAIPAAAATVPDAPVDRARLFADCAGRYSALAEHRMLFDGPASETALAQRDLFVTLLDAVLPDAPSVSSARAMAWRVEAKAAHRGLLSAAAFGTDRKGRGPARALADTLIAACDTLVLGV